MDVEHENNITIITKKNVSDVRSESIYVSLTCHFVLSQLIKANDKNYCQVNSWKACTAVY